VAAVVREVLDHVRSLVVPGATTMDLERAAEKKMTGAGREARFKATTITRACSAPR